MKDIEKANCDEEKANNCKLIENERRKARDNLIFCTYLQVLFGALFVFWFYGFEIVLGAEIEN